MEIATLNERVACTEDQVRLAYFDVSEIQSLLLQNVGANIVEVGAQGITYGVGYRIGIGSTLNLSWEDFSEDIRKTHALVYLWGICDTGLTSSVQVFGFIRRR
jgi:hypothetical protein